MRLLDPAFAGDDQSADHVETVVQVIVLGIDVDADQIGILGGVAVGKRAVSLAGNIGDGLDRVLHERAVAAGAVDQFVHARTDGPGCGEVPREVFLAGDGHQIRLLLRFTIDIYCALAAKVF